MTVLADNSSSAALARAVELDDPHPDDVCPGCLHPVHNAGMYVDGYEWCPWDSDYLLARRFRRDYITRHTAVAS